MADSAETRSEALREFVSRHPDGWHHGAWEQLLHELRTRGWVREGEEERVGAELERTRVLATLEGLTVRGLGPKRRGTIADAYPRLWDLRHAGVDDLAELPGVTRSIAEGVARGVR